jgi:uncharacterized membrane protein YagU involved in acid resistance
VAIKSNAFVSIVGGGLTLGVLDLAESIVVVAFSGVPPVRVLKSIATGLLGASAFQGGTGTALLGLGIHFTISFVVAAVFWIASRQFTALVEHPWVSGLLYGCLVFLFMDFVALPLSSAVRPPFSIGIFVHGLIKHAVLVGLPVSLITAGSERVSAVAA